MDRFVENIRRNNPEIYAFIQKKKRKKILAIIFIELVILALGFLGKASLEKFGSKALLMILPFLLVVPFIVKPRKIIFDKIWQGRIERIDYFTGMVNNDITVRSQKLTRFHHIILLIVDDEGNDHQITLDKKYEKCYAVGDRVVHLPGLVYPANLDGKKRERRVCVCCGSIAPHTDADCVGCGNPFFES